MVIKMFLHLEVAVLGVVFSGQITNDTCTGFKVELRVNVVGKRY